MSAMSDLDVQMQQANPDAQYGVSYPDGVFITSEHPGMILNFLGRDYDALWVRRSGGWDRVPEFLIDGEAWQ